MLYLVFDIGDEGYALPADHVVELLPFITPKPIRDAPAEIAGAISYRGGYLPVVDVSRLELGRPAHRSLGTRIAVTAIPAGGRTEILGLILENATEMLRCEPAEFNPFAAGPRGLVQAFDLAALLPAQVIDAIAQSPDLRP